MNHLSNRDFIIINHPYVGLDVHKGASIPALQTA